MELDPFCHGDAPAAQLRTHSQPGGWADGHWAVALDEKFNFNYMTGLKSISIQNLILKLVCFLQLFYLSTPLGVIFVRLAVKAAQKEHKVC